jgi:hypothetical protein
LGFGLPLLVFLTRYLIPYCRICLVHAVERCKVGGHQEGRYLVGVNLKLPGRRSEPEISYGGSQTSLESLDGCCGILLFEGGGKVHFVSFSRAGNDASSFGEGEDGPRELILAELAEASESLLGSMDHRIWPWFRPELRDGLGVHSELLGTPPAANR